MKNLVALCFVMLMSLAGIGSVLAQGSEAGRFYAHLDLGGSIVEDTDVEEFFGPSRGVEVEFGPGVRLDLGGGYQVTDWFGVEMETGFTSMFIDDLNGLPGVNVHDSSLTLVPLMVNVVFQVPNRSRVVPFVGGGVGGALSMFFADDITDYDTFVVDGSDTDAVFAFQGFGGLRVLINDNMSAGLVYKYLFTEGGEWDVDTFFEPSVGDIAFDEVTAHSISAFFSVRF